VRLPRAQSQRAISPELGSSSPHTARTTEIKLTPSITVIAEKVLLNCAARVATERGSDWPTRPRPTTELPTGVDNETYHAVIREGTFRHAGCYGCWEAWKQATSHDHFSE